MKFAYRLSGISVIFANFLSANLHTLQKNDEPVVPGFRHFDQKMRNKAFALSDFEMLALGVFRWISAVY